MCANGGDYIDSSTLDLKKPLSWYQFQYCLIHRDGLAKVPTDAEAKAECAEKYDWKYGTSSGGEEPPTPSKPEIKVDPTTWSKFMQSAGSYYENWDAAAFTFSPFNDTVVKDNLLLRGDDAGTVITAAELFAGNADAMDMIITTMDAISMCANGGDYIDSSTLALIKEPSWYQFQYCLIHRDNLAEVPDEATAKAECEAKWEWKYGTGGGGGGEDPDPPEPPEETTKTEIPVDAGTWNDFMRSAGAYYELWDASAFTFPLSDSIVKDTLLLRSDDAGTVITASALFAGNPDAMDLVISTMDAISMCANGGDYIDMSSLALVKAPTWYQFQYALIHRDSLTILPDDATCKAECEAKWDWKYDTSGGGGGEQPDPGDKTEIPVDAGTWSSFMQSAGAYYELWDASEFTFVVDDSVVKDTLLLRGDDAGTVITAAELFAGNPDAMDMIITTMDAISMCANGGDYIDSSSLALIKEPSWYQFQYALIHRDSLSELPDDATCKAECEAKWAWKYTTS